MTVVAPRRGHRATAVVAALTGVAERVRQAVPVGDAVLVASLAVLSLAVPFVPGLDIGLVGDTAAHPHAGLRLVPVTAALTLPLLARRRLPGVVLLTVAGALVVRQESGLPPLAADFALLVALVAAGHHTRGRQWWLVGLYAVHPLVAALVPGQGLRGWSLAVELLVVVVLPIALGLALRARDGQAARTRATGAAGAPGAAGPFGDAGGRDADVPVSSGDDVAPGPGLTAREVQVLALVADGRSNPEIAAALAVSPETVKTHLGRARHKLGARDRTAAALRAADLGLLTVPPPGDTRG